MKRTILTLLAATALFAASPASAEIRKITIEPKEGGWKLSELFRLVSKHTGVKIVYDPETGEGVLDLVIRFEGIQTVPKEQFFAWIQSLLSFQRIVLVPAEEGTWVALKAEPRGCRPIFVFEEDIGNWADREGVYLVSSIDLRLPELQDRAVRIAEGLATPEIGRVNTVPGGKTLVLAGFASDVARMIASVRAMEDEWAEREIARLEEMLAGCRTESAALYLLERISRSRNRSAAR